MLFYRIVWLGYPLFPTAPGQVWQLLINAHVKDEEKEINLEIGLPSEHAGRMLVEERITSGNMNFALLRKGPNRIGVWAGTPDPEGEEISYQTTILVRPRRTPKDQPPVLEAYPAAVGKEEQDLAQHLATRWNHLDPLPRIRAVGKTALGEWGLSPPEEHYLKAWKTLQEKHGRVRTLLLLFRAANLSARVVEGLRFVEGIRIKPLTWIEAWNGKRWEVIWPGTGEIDQNPGSFLPLATGDLPSVRISGGELLEIRWSLSRQILSKWNLHFERIRRSDHFLDHWSLFRLPPEFQQTFRILLLVPIGVLIISVLRNLVGFPTFGIFMPVLMALAFRNTGLAYGLGIFAGVLLVGYTVRRGLDKLHLLLVPRMSLIVTLVISCFTVLALIGSKLGLREFMAVGLLPFVILTMVIERFFVLVEEAGVREGIRTAVGSAAVSLISYQIISWEPLQLTFFVYPELMAPVAGLQILLGRYTGYRLSELFRFKTLRKTP
ncbi:MAG: UUP1 family membrane protein [Deltaproteobacteria bacterium]|nr:UUP1 family membrane protein [Deltaproteobacteria bacterium]